MYYDSSKMNAQNARDFSRRYNIFADSSISLSLVTDRVSLSFSSIDNLVYNVADINDEKIKKKRHLNI